jgi:hypothetical protein
MAEIISKAIACLKYTTGANTYLASCLSFPKNMLPEETKKRLSKHTGEKKLLWKNKEDRRILNDRQTTCKSINNQ